MKMKRLFVLWAVLALALTPVFAAAQERGTAEEAKALVQKAAAYVKEVGKEKGLAEINNPKGKFVYKDLYVFAGDFDGLCLAHPATPALVGKNTLNIKDADGKPFIKDRNEIAKKAGKGTIEYRWPHPKTKKVEHKAAYFEKVGDIVLTCGYYK